ncbi:MAG: S-adenosylmethionine decarboxylase [Chloroflexi bacterium]|nr:S-adenosylmethionine decarboxylase [Chloroflexota bacterium]MCK4262441.1 S-adenosylmethionine decarboxylase [Dehalococcoidia bacterium]
MHLIIDGYSDNKELLQDESHLHKWLERCPAAIGMNRISPPYVLRYVGSNLEDWGISGFVFIAESHISVHTFVDRGYVNMDVFSCRDFNADKAIEDIRNEFQLSRLRSSVIDREWSPEIAATTDTVGFTHHVE